MEKKVIVTESIRSVSETLNDAPIDEYDAAAALAEVNEELGGDANSLMQSMQNLMDAFSREENSPSPAVAENPFAFTDTDNPFEDEEDQDPFQQEDPNATRVLNLKDLQFGRNYIKD